MAKTLEEMKSTTFKFIDNTCQDIARARRMSEIEGIDVEEFDKHLNERCTFWAEYYKDMNPTRLLLEGLTLIFEAGDGREFMDDLMREIGE